MCTNLLNKVRLDCTPSNLIRTQVPVLRVQKCTPNNLIRDQVSVPKRSGIQIKARISDEKINVDSRCSRSSQNAKAALSTVSVLKLS